MKDRERQLEQEILSERDASPYVPDDLIEDGFIPHTDTRYYIGYETPTGKQKLVRVSKTLYDSRMNRTRQMIQNVRIELGKYVKRRS